MLIPWLFYFRICGSQRDAQHLDPDISRYNPCYISQQLDCHPTKIGWNVGLQPPVVDISIWVWALCHKFLDGPGENLSNDRASSCRARIEMLNDVHQWVSLEYNSFYLGELCGVVQAPHHWLLWRSVGWSNNCRQSCSQWNGILNLRCRSRHSLYQLCELLWWRLVVEWMPFNLSQWEVWCQIMGIIPLLVTRMARTKHLQAGILWRSAGWWSNALLDPWFQYCLMFDNPDTFQYICNTNTKYWL